MGDGITRICIIRWNPLYRDKYTATDKRRLQADICKKFFEKGLDIVPYPIKRRIEAEGYRKEWNPLFTWYGYNADIENAVESLKTHFKQLGTSRPGDISVVNSY